MAIQILPSSPGIGALLGSGVGAGIQQSRRSEALRALGIPADKAYQISHLPDAFQQQIVGNFLRGKQFLQQDIEAQEGIPASPAAAPNMSASPAMAALAPAQQQVSPIEKLLGQNNPFMPLGIGSLAKILGHQEPLAPLIAPQKQVTAAPAQRTPPAAPASPAAPQQQKAAPARREPSFEETLAAGMQDKEAIKERQLAQKQIYEQEKTLHDRATLAKNGNEYFKSMLRRVKSGRLPGPGWNAADKFLKKLGIDLGAFLLGSEGQGFEKDRIKFIENAKFLFGGRPAAAEVLKWLETLPTLADTDEAKLGAIEAGMAMNDAMIAREKAYNAIVREHGGRRPYNIMELAEERAKEETDRAYEKFTEALEIGQGQWMNSAPKTAKEGDKWRQNGVTHVFRNGSWDPPLKKR